MELDSNRIRKKSIRSAPAWHATHQNGCLKSGVSNKRSIRGPDHKSHRAHDNVRVGVDSGLVMWQTRLDILLEAIYSPLECLPKNKKNASSCCKAPWTC